MGVREWWKYQKATNGKNLRLRVCLGRQSKTSLGPAVFHTESIMSIHMQCNIWLYVYIYKCMIHMGRTSVLEPWTANYRVLIGMHNMYR